LLFSRNNNSRWPAHAGETGTVRTVEGADQ